MEEQMIEQVVIEDNEFEVKGFRPEQATAIEFPTYVNLSNKMLLDMDDFVMAYTETKRFLFWKKEYTIVILKNGSVILDTVLDFSTLTRLLNCIPS